MAEKRIMIETDSLDDSAKSVIKTIFSANLLEEISSIDMESLTTRIKCGTNDSTNKSESNDKSVRPILIYPPTGKGGLSINTEDYACLAVDQYLNDVIIDFYLKYVLTEMLTEEQQAKTHIFSTFFYKRLTTMNAKGKKDNKLSAAQKRHERVKNWTKAVNLFEKDFIIIPINEQSHWFLAIICFPALKGPVTMNGNEPVKILPLAKKPKSTAERKTSVALQIGNTTITPVSKKEVQDSIHLDDESERDEAEGDESELGSDDSDTESTAPEPKPSTQPIKLLVFFL